MKPSFLGAIVLLAALGQFDAKAQQNSGAVSGGASITGRVFDLSDHRPVFDATVVAHLMSGSVRSNIQYSGQTDREGLYHLAGLQGGRYSLDAVAAGYLSSPFVALWRIIDVKENGALENVDVNLNRGGSLSGAVQDEQQEPLPGVTVRALARRGNPGRVVLREIGQAVTNKNGLFRINGLMPDRYILVAEVLSMVNASREARGIIRTYFPSERASNSAALVAVSPGAEVDDLVIKVRHEQTFKVNGTIDPSLLETGSSRKFELRVVATATPFDTTNVLTAPIAANGTFEVGSIPGGNYTFQLHRAQSKTLGAERLLSSLTLLVNKDVEGLFISGEKSALLQGHLKAPAVVDFSSARIMLEPADPSLSSFELIEMSVSRTGSFAGKAGIRPGPYHLIVTPPTDYYVAGVTLGGAPMPELLINLPAGGSGDLEVALDHASSIKGQVNWAGAKEKPNIVVFLPGPRGWPPILGRVQADGKFTVSSVPPGSYLAVALETFDPEIIGRSEVFELLKSAFISVDVNGENGRDLQLPLLSSETIRKAALDSGLISF